jgi:ketosteroid isomerase-like protein
MALMLPEMSVLQFEDGKIIWGRVYTDTPTHDGISITDLLML